MTEDSLLTITLKVAVPLWAAQMSTWEPRRLVRVARECCDTIASHGDDILYQSKHRGDTAKAFNALAQGIAVLAMQPGGVTVFGVHWCTDHRACVAADEEADFTTFVTRLRDLTNRMLVDLGEEECK